MNQKDNINIAIVGGGPSGMMAAYAASLNENANIDLYERNEKLGKKLYITGKGRCNLTNSGMPEDFFKAITKNEKFFYSSFYTFDNNALMGLIESAGTQLKSERGNRVFPASDKSSDILKALSRILNKSNINILLDKKIENVDKAGDKFTVNNKIYDKVIIAGGGKSYPMTGSDGNTYEIAKNLGHTITKISAGLCGINTTDMDTFELSGLSLKNVVLSAKLKGKTVFSELGEMEFTHYGISGPIVLSLSSVINIEKIKKYEIYIDLKSGLDETKLQNRIIRDIEKEPNKDVKNTLGNLLPFRLMEKVILRSGVDLNKKSNQLTKEERILITENLKKFSISAQSLRPVEEGIITRGGVALKEINASTMESKLVEGLYFAGEIIDLDAVTGGFNLQIAFSTGYLAGLSAAE